MNNLLDLWQNAYKNHERDPIVWQNILSHLGRLAALMSYTDCLDEFKGFTHEMLLPVLEVVGWQAKGDRGETSIFIGLGGYGNAFSIDHLESLLRESVLDRLVKSGHPATVKHAQELFEKYLNGDSDVPSEIRRAVSPAAGLCSW